MGVGLMQGTRPALLSRSTPCALLLCVHMFLLPQHPEASLPQIPPIIYPSTYVPKSPPSTPTHGLLPVCSKTCTPAALSLPFPTSPEPVTSYWPRPTGGLGGVPCVSAGSKCPGLTRTVLHSWPWSFISVSPGLGGGEVSPPHAEEMRSNGVSSPWQSPLCL